MFLMKWWVVISSHRSAQYKCSQLPESGAAREGEMSSSVELENQNYKQLVVTVSTSRENIFNVSQKVHQKYQKKSLCFINQCSCYFSHLISTTRQILVPFYTKATKLLYQREMGTGD